MKYFYLTLGILLVLGGYIAFTTMFYPLKASAQGQLVGKFLVPGKYLHK